MAYTNGIFTGRQKGRAGAVGAGTDQCFQTLFKRAVKRNRVKRQIREAFRYNKMALEEQMKELSGKQLLVAFIWQDGKLHESAEINAKMHQQMKRLVEKLQNETGVKKSSCAEPGL